MSQNRSGSRAVSSAPTGRDAAISIGIGRYEDQQSDNMESAIGLAPNLLYESPISFQSMVESSVSRWIVDEIILDELIYLHWSYKAGLVHPENRSITESPAANARAVTAKPNVPNNSLGTASEAKVPTRVSESGANGSKPPSQSGNLSSGNGNTNTQPVQSSGAAPMLSPSKPLSSQPTSSATTICPACSEQVGSQRFAYHLFKCMGNGRKAAKPRRAAAAGFASMNSNNADDSSKLGGQQTLNNSNISGAEITKNGGTKRSAAMMRDIEFFQDKPVIVKIKLNEKGLPLSKQSREIISYDEFLSVVNSQNR